MKCLPLTAKSPTAASQLISARIKSETVKRVNFWRSGILEIALIKCRSGANQSVWGTLLSTRDKFVRARQSHWKALIGRRGTSGRVANKPSSLLSLKRWCCELPFADYTQNFHNRIPIDSGKLSNSREWTVQIWNICGNVIVTVAAERKCNKLCEYFLHLMNFCNIVKASEHPYHLRLPSSHSLI